MKISTTLMALAIACLGFGLPSLHAQLGLNWEEIGPNNTGNHVRAIATAPNGTVWAGSVGGGLWKSTNRGLTWWQVPEVDANMAVSCIAIEGNNIYVGTGETYFVKPESAWVGNWTPDSIATMKEGILKYAGQPGQGVFVSNDGGTTWSHSNGTWNALSQSYRDPFTSIQHIEVKNGVVLIATLKGLYRSATADLSLVSLASGDTLLTKRTVTDVATTSCTPQRQIPSIARPTAARLLARQWKVACP
jgi:hypothetical protein